MIKHGTTVNVLSLKIIDTISQGVLEIPREARK
jgi:hypothetical protein